MMETPTFSAGSTNHASTVEDSFTHLLDLTLVKRPLGDLQDKGTQHFNVRGTGREAAVVPAQCARPGAALAHCL
jgi:hypothetical protein